MVSRLLCMAIYISQCMIMLPGVQSIYAQTIPTDRTTIWEEAGLQTDISTSQTMNILDNGADPLGILNSSPAILSTISALEASGGGICYIPEGTYLLNQTINVPSNISILGDGFENTIINFDLDGGHGFNLSGQLTGTADPLLAAITKGDYILSVADGSIYFPGEIIRLVPQDGDLVTSAWAIGSTGQIAIIESIDGNDLTLYQPLRMDYPMSMMTVVRKVEPVSNSRISCLRINRLDITTSQTRNIYMGYTYNCEISSVESNLTNYAHVSLTFSLHNWIYGCYFHHAHDYGPGGKAYGVSIELGACMNLVENNIFNTLRHSILFQAGANANVVSYNYSLNPNRTEFFNTYSGDLVFHGNYPYLNLAEGNIMQNIFIDNSHGLNGPYNTIFRNRAELFGLIMTSSSDGQNFVGTEITGTFYTLSGNDHFVHRVNHQGTWYPSNTGALNEASLYLTGQPVFAPTWPCIGYPVPYNSCKNDAQARYEANTPITPCSVILPIDLLAFDVRRNDVKVNISWVTSMELGNEYYEIERSQNGKDFHVLGEVTGASNSYVKNTYSFMDENPQAGINYYRLKQVDYDGMFMYSQVRSVFFDANGKSMSLYPNPAKDRLLLNTRKKNGSVKLQIIDYNGYVMYEKKYMQGEWGTSQNLDITDMAEGMYILKIEEENQIEIARFVKVN